MPVPYDTTFTLTDGTITLTWNARPGQLNFDPNAISAIAPLPLSNQSRFQPLGHGGLLVDWVGACYVDNRGTADPTTYPGINTHIVMAGVGTPDPYNAQDIIQQLRTWRQNGTTLTFVSDEIREYTGAANMTVKMSEFTYQRNSGHTYDYDYRIGLIEYDAGSAI